MKFSENWLRDWIDLPVDNSILYEQIINSGIEIESVQIIESLSNNIVVGKIIDCINHIISNELKIVTVDIGMKKLLNIVCRASNCRVGIKVVVATIGSVLPNKTVINKRIIQGETSEGMLCSFLELGLFHSKHIIEIDNNISIGKSINDIFLLKDNIIKISTTPNRPDSLHILGLARNIAAINNLPCPAIKSKINSIRIKKKFLINIESDVECMYFSGRIIQNVNVNIETPFWMKKKLFFCDLLSDNVITNIINYVLIEIGQPVYVMDADQIDDFIILRMANYKENIILKDKKKINLDKNILIITDSKKILSIPGNIYSHTVEINSNSQNICIGTALFSQKVISNIIQKFPSNHILEYYHYGIDPSLQKHALEYATNLIVNICGGLPGPVTKTESIYKFHKHHIKLYHDNINKISGIFIAEDIILSILKRLNYTIISKEQYWNLISPPWRFDIVIEEDVISDILRIYGYNNIVFTPLQKILIVNENNNLQDVTLDTVKNLLVHQGYSEVINYSFIDPKIHNILFSNNHPLLIANPISQDMSCMRSSLWPGLIKNVSYNKNRKNNSMRFFESGLCFVLDSESNLGVKQELFLGAIISGNYMQENWHSKIRKMDFYDLKGTLECVLELICGLDDIEFRQEKILGLHPQQSAAIYLCNQFIGSIGAIDPTFEKELDIHEATFVFEIIFNNIINTQKIKIHAISKFPTSRRDISILISDNISIFHIIQECKNFFIDKKVEINLFDVYTFIELDQTKKSIGISFIFQDYKKTLKENEINFMLDSCIQALNEKFQIIVRKQNDGADKS